MNTFEINDNDSFIVYGAAYLGCDICDKLKHLGYRVSLFMDNRADSIKRLAGIKVIHPDKYMGDFNEVIIIATGNPVSVANKLFNKGFRKIVFDPMLNDNSSEELNYMSKKYDNFMIKSERLTGKIPLYDPNIMDYRFIDAALFSQCNNGIVKAFVTTDLLFTEVKGVMCPIYCVCPEYLDYIKAYDGNVGEISDTIIDLSYKIKPEEYMGSDFGNEVENRRLFTQTQLNKMNFRLNQGMEWFKENAIFVKFSSGRFIMEKKNLFPVCFLLSKGLQKIPAIMTKSDYDMWINRRYLKEAVAYAKTHDLLTAYTMLEHPFFYNFPATRDIGGNARMMHICRYLYENHIEVDGKRIIDIGSYFGFLSRFFYRMGANVTSVEYNVDTFGMGKVLNNLLRCEKIETICGAAQNISKDRTFDFSVMLTVLYWHLGTEVGVQLIKTVDSITNDKMFWESGNDPEYEKSFIFEHSSFKQFEKICETTGTGKVRELGVFMK